MKLFALERVTSVGAEVSKFKVGETVAVGTMVDSCRVCEQCKQGLEPYCEGPVGGRIHITVRSSRTARTRSAVIRTKSSPDKDAERALGNFRRFPLWMWRNEDVLKFVEWLREHNADKSPTRQAGFYGIDLYSLHASMEAVLGFLEKVDPDAAKQARLRYSCFDHFGEDAQSYGYAVSYDERFSCEDEAVKQLVELQRRAAEYANRDGFIARATSIFSPSKTRGS